MVAVVPIADPADPRVADYLDIRERDLAGRSGSFVAEGEVVVRTLLSGRSHFRARSVLLAAGRLGFLDRLEAPLPHGLDVYEGAQPVMDRIVGFPIHRGILAIGERGRPIAPDTVLPPPDRPALVVGLVGLANHDNVGAVFRNAAAFGAAGVMLDETCCDPLYRKAIRVSTGACLTVPFGRLGSAAELVGFLRAARFEVVALSPRGGEPIEEARWPDRTALLLGPEGAGLPAELLDRCRTVRIRMAPDHDSLNVATAAAIALHRARSRI